MVDVGCVVWDCLQPRRRCGDRQQKLGGGALRPTSLDKRRVPPDCTARPWIIDRPRPGALADALGGEERLDRRASTSPRPCRCRCRRRACAGSRPGSSPSSDAPATLMLVKRMVTAPPFGMASRAFSARLSMASSSWLGSTSTGRTAACAPLMLDADQRPDRLLEQAPHPLDQIGHIDRSAAGGPGAGRKRAGAGSAPRPAPRPASPPSTSAAGCGRLRHAASQQVEIGDHGHQQVVEVVRHAAGELAERLQLLRLPQLLLGALQRGDVASPSATTWTTRAGIVEHRLHRKVEHCVDAPPCSANSISRTGPTPPATPRGNARASRRGLCGGQEPSSGRPPTSLLEPGNRSSADPGRSPRARCRWHDDATGGLGQQPRSGKRCRRGAKAPFARLQLAGASSTRRPSSPPTRLRSVMSTTRRSCAAACPRRRPARGRGTRPNGCCRRARRIGNSQSRSPRRTRCCARPQPACAADPRGDAAEDRRRSKARPARPNIALHRSEVDSSPLASIEDPRSRGGPP